MRRQHRRCERGKPEALTESPKQMSFHIPATGRAYNTDIRREGLFKNIAQIVRQDAYAEVLPTQLLKLETAHAHTKLQAES